MNNKISFNEMVQNAAIEAVNRALDAIPLEVFASSDHSEEEQALMKKLFESENPEEQDKLLKELIHCSVEKL